MKTLLDLAKSMDKLNVKVKTAASEAAVFTAIYLISDLARITPVDTSTALSSWIASISLRSHAKPGAHKYGHMGSTQGVSVRATIDAAQAVLRQKAPGQSIWISNNEDYIDDLNNGSSKQAPAGFVERCELNARLALRNYTIKLEL